MKNIVVIGVFMISFFSFSQEKNDTDYLILKVILEDFRNENRDSLTLIESSSNEAIINFFSLRDIVEREFYCIDYKGNKIRLPLKHHDSISFECDTIIYAKQLIDKDEYISKGKGVNKKAELFLKDSFELKKREISWEINKPIFNVFAKSILNNKESIFISAPIFNTSNNKAIIYLSKSKETIYFLSKGRAGWKIIFKQTDFPTWHIRLKEEKMIPMRRGLRFKKIKE